MQRQVQANVPSGQLAVTGQIEHEKLRQVSPGRVGQRLENVGNVGEARRLRHRFEIEDDQLAVGLTLRPPNLLKKDGFRAELISVGWITQRQDVRVRPAIQSLFVICQKRLG